MTPERAIWGSWRACVVLKCSKADNANICSSLTDTLRQLGVFAVPTVAKVLQLADFPACLHLKESFCFLDIFLNNIGDDVMAVLRSSMRHCVIDAEPLENSAVGPQAAAASR